MADYDNRNTGILFKNDKEGNEKRPDYTGKFTDADNKEWRLAAWVKQGQKGKFLSLRVSEDQSADQKRDDTPAGGGSVDLDEVPF
tara:strand:- start:456 stop:710 length:255 start_codon:yes stop_codon:yes gene_type:complete